MSRERAETRGRLKMRGWTRNGRGRGGGGDNGKIEMKQLTRLLRIIRKEPDGEHWKERRNCDSRRVIWRSEAKDCEPGEFTEDNVRNGRFFPFQTTRCCTCNGAVYNFAYPCGVSWLWHLYKSHRMCVKLICGPLFGLAMEFVQRCLRGTGMVSEWRANLIKSAVRD